ncbi:MAG: methylenetetrahydrofolate dehydrogenase [Ruthenibacterium sp.]
MKARIPMHREFVIQIADDYDKKDECWQKLDDLMTAYKKEGKSVYTPSFIEDNEAKVKALQETYTFTYTVEERK